MTGADERRWTLLADPEGAAGQSGKPAVGRTVAVDDVDALGRERAPQRDKTCRPLAADRQCEDGDPKAFRLAKDRRIARTGDPHVVTAAPHAGCFGEDAQLLASPPKAGVRVQNAHCDQTTAVAVAN